MEKILSYFWSFSNPNKFIKLSDYLIPPLWFFSISFLSIGLIWGFFFTPDDYLQGSTIKIIYIHVPSAFLAINIYFMMFVTSLVWLIRRHHVSALASKSAAPIGFVMTITAMITGAFWGQPIWGTYWVWDPRLTSFAIMATFYFGYMFLWTVIDNKEKAADLTSILCLIGSVFALLSRYAILFWDQGLHQGSTLSLDKEENISNIFFFPLITSMIGFFFLFLLLLFIRIKTEIYIRRIEVIQKMQELKDA